MKKITLFFFLAFYANFFGQNFGIIPYASGFNSITEIVNAGDSRLFVVEQTGAIKIIKPLEGVGVVNTLPFLTLPSNVINYDGVEGGLLGLAFHPNFASNRYFYVKYTRAGDGVLVIARYTASETDADVAIPDSGIVLLTIAQTAGIHHGGTIRFGPDGYLYSAIGDGGLYNEILSLSQDVNSNRGKILRIDVDAFSPYGSPPSNPFMGISGNDEIWAMGLRNPWKFSFNRITGDLWIADVGEGTAEEVNKVASPLPNTGLNFGWRCYEGNFANNFAGCGDVSTYTPPLATYTKSSIDGCAVVGGYYYTGSQYPNFNGKYIFGDFCASKILTLTDDGTFTVSPAIAGLFLMTTFGEDATGELYVSGENGMIYRLVDTTLGTNSFAENGLSLYPNPAGDQVFLTNTSNKSLSKFRVYDVSGKLLLEQTIDETTTNNINTDALQSGLYVATVQDASGALFTSKLIIK